MASSSSIVIVSNPCVDIMMAYSTSTHLVKMSYPHNDIMTLILEWVDAKDLPKILYALYDYCGLDSIVKRECRNRLAERGIICAPSVEIPEMLDQLGVPPYCPENHFYSDGLIPIEEEYKSCSSKSEREALEYERDDWDDEYDPSYYY